MDRFMDMVCAELDKFADTGITSANLDRAYKLSQIKDNLMDYEYKQTKKYMMDSTGDYSHDYMNDIRGGTRGGIQNTRSSHGVGMMAVSGADTMYDEYMEAKKNYRYAHTIDSKRELLDKLEKYMDEYTQKLQEIMRDADCQEERALISRYVLKMRDYK